MNKKSYLIIAILLLQLSISCKTSIVEKTVPADLPSKFMGEKNPDSLSIGNLQWRQFYKDPQLKNLIDSAVVRNNDLLEAMKNVEASQLLLKKSKWVNVPTLNAEVTGTYTYFSDNSLNGLSTATFLEQNHLEDYTAQGVLSWEADIWGKLKNQKRKALAEYIQTDEVKKAIQTSIVARVAESYFNLLMLDAQLEVAKKTWSLESEQMQLLPYNMNRAR
ncbi:TolC family protein [Antarcticibacterium sp. 1MA-6-2]|uniref:TolC family protein n=1 Tax=Antarcticibacterium sp. 1MA-6-2 TaxID=2908210 RepID=UPI001F480F34|nr:TolC family protein [Antarcticibacterium sp. 1MA-6-2]UJH91954.1 TolC family protein [Antarcticibacterium sp. 1MA-6-2]